VAAEGTLFENTYAQQVWTMTSHLTMVTGLYPNAHGAARSHPASEAATTLAEILQEHGFETAAFMGTGGWAGPKFGLGRGFESFKVGVSDAREDNLMRLTWLEKQALILEADPSHRFFMLAHYFDVHSDHDTDVPYSVPDPFKLRYLSGELDWNRRGATALLMEMQRNGDVNLEDRRVLTALYDAGVRFTDELGLAPLLDKLRELGLYDDTLIIITSDHGEEIFEHGACCHLQPYEETSRVPLVMRGPGVPRGRRVREIVELVDIMPTVLALVGFADAVPDHVQGQDLAPLMRGDRSNDPARAYVDGLFGAIPPRKFHGPSNLIAEIDGRRWSLVNTVHESVVDGERIFETRTPAELYLLDSDPGQKVNLIAAEPELADKLQAQLLAWYRKNELLARRLGQGPIKENVLREADREKLRALGYLE